MPRVRRTAKKTLTPIWTSTELRNLMNNRRDSGAAANLWQSAAEEQEHADLSLVSLNEAGWKIETGRKPNHRLLARRSAIGGKTILVFE